jgi:hypothetical protein
MIKFEGNSLRAIIINAYLFALYAFGVLCIIGWVYGLYVSLKAGNLALAVVGFIVLPVGIVNGWGAFLGFW